MGVGFRLPYSVKMPPGKGGNAPEGFRVFLNLRAICCFFNIFYK